MKVIKCTNFRSPFQVAGSTGSPYTVEVANGHRTALCCANVVTDANDENKCYTAAGIVFNTFLFKSF